MRSLLSTYIRYTLLLALGIGLLILAFRGVNLSATLQEIRTAHIPWLLVSIATSLVAFISRAIRWNLLIEPLGYRPALRNTAYSLLVGYLANLALPRLGEVTRCGSLNRVEKVPFDLLLGTVIMERALDVVCLLLCLTATAIIEFQRLGNFINNNLLSPLREKAGNTMQSPLVLLSVLLLVVLVVVLWRAGNRKDNSLGFLHRIRGLMKGVVQGLRSIGRLQKPGAFVFHTVLIWFMYYLMSYTCFFALDATAGLSWQAGLFVLVVGGMGMSAPVQGGIGAYHLLVSQGLMLYGISHEHGLAFATLMHASQTLVVILLGGISFLMLVLAQKKISHATTGTCPEKNP